MTTTHKTPEWLEPMAATLTQDRFVGRDWLFERKFDGIRLLAYKRGTDVRLYSRNRLPQHLPAIAKAVAILPVRDVILDGEVAWDGHQEFVVGGFTDPQGGRVGFGALLVGYHEGSGFVFAGKIGTGFNTKLLLTLRKRRDARERATSPFTKAEGSPRLRVHWVSPHIVVQVAFIEGMRQKP
jgi:ATP-dependent DNA ligase